MREPKESVRGWSPAPKAQSLLLSCGSDYPVGDGTRGTALGTGIIVIVGTARSAKTCGLALPLIEWAILADRSRSAVFLGMPDAFTDALPDSFKGRSSNPEFHQLTQQRDSIILIDDTAVHLNARDSSNTTNRLLNRLAGVISHLGLTLIICVQSMAGVDVGLLRYCEMAVLVKRIDPMALQHERNQWQPSLSDAQRMLRSVEFDRSFYVSTSDGLLCEAPWPLWVRERDELSRPFRFLSQERLDALINGHNTTRHDHREAE